MIKEFVEAWDAHKCELQAFLEKHEQVNYDSYKKLVILLFDIVINPYLVNEKKKNAYDSERIVTIDDGEWQGTQVFILPEDTYQPNIYEYVMTYVEYGSCSGCDTLLAISKYDEDLPSKEQVKDYMMLCLHLLQRCKIPFSYYEYMNDLDNED